LLQFWKMSLVAVIVVGLTLSGSGSARASDPSCSPDASRWHAVFDHNTTVAPMRGVHGRVQKVPMTVSGSGVADDALWAFPSSTGVWFFEIGFGYNTGYSGHGPDWYEYHVNGAGEFWTVQLPWDASVDYSLHDVTVKWIGSGGAYYGYIDGSVAVYATGYSDAGIYKRQIGAETASCHSVVQTAQFDQFTDQAWDASWGPSVYGEIVYRPQQTPPNAGWYSTYTWGWAEIK
jgi:hypothetical protein